LGTYRGVNNIRKGKFISEVVAEKYIGNISKDSEDFSKFQSEMLYVNDLSRDCKNILSVNGYLERNGLWVIEDWGEYDLSDYLKTNPNLDWGIKLAIARGISNALNHIHNLNLLHYNVKSNNVFLNRDLEPKLHKFGKDADNCIYLKSAQSLNNLAPEVKRKEKYSSASEVYSFGVVLWEIATQKCSSENDFTEQGSKHIDGAPVNYLTLMEKALNEEPGDRPTMQVMFDSLYELESSYNIRLQKKLSTITNSVLDSPVDSPISPISTSPASPISPVTPTYSTSSTNSTSATSPASSISPNSPPTLLDGKQDFLFFFFFFSFSFFLFLFSFTVFYRNHLITNQISSNFFRSYVIH
jgi:serine/threonine protein kinase